MTDSPTSPIPVLAWSGSLRRGSSNTGLVRLALRIADDLAPGALDVTWVDWLDQLPYYNPDYETDGVPEVAQRWRDAVQGCRGMLIGMPEYNGGMSAVAKNAFDWATRPPGQHALTGKVVAMLTSGGGGGGKYVQAGVTPLFGWLGNTVVDGSPVLVVKGMELIDGEGTTSDTAVADAVRGKVEAFLAALRPSA